MTQSSSVTPTDITPITIEEEMQRSYLDYAMSVIVSRALPDVRDGLKPVHRRILYAMEEGGNDYNKPHRKSARVVGDVMGKYHPHGDLAIYDAMARMAQSWSLRVPLIDGHGNFGSMDGDPPAASRYTEARLAKVSHTLLEDMDKETVTFQPNYDNTTSEPVVLPARFPNILVNGGGGIAVGMATNIPPHNLGEVIDACCAMIENPDLTVEEVMQYIQGPDFPTGGLILGRAGIHSAYSTGRGSIIMRARTHVETVRKDREAIVVTEIPYQVNKAKMIERMAELVNAKTIEGISDLRDESSREGVRVVIELKKDAFSEVVLNQLYRYSPLQTSFGANVLALNKGRPEMLALRDILKAFLEFREDVIVKRTRYELKKGRERAHLLLGLTVAVANLDEMIALIRGASDPATARERMMARAWPVLDVAPLIERVGEPGHGIQEGGVYHLTEAQAKAILDLKLHRLTGLERDRLSDDLKSVTDRIEELLSILRSREKLLEVMTAEFREIKENFATPRRTEIIESEFTADIEDLIQREEMVVTVSHTGYIKRVPLSAYRAQRRGGKGRSGMATREEDFVRDLFVANTHTPVLFFSSLGKAYELKVYRLPIGSPQSRGKALVNILPLAKGENITAVMPLPEDEETWKDLHIMFATSSGGIRRNALSDFLNIKSNGKIAMKLGEGESLVGVEPCQEDQDILLATRYGKCIRFGVDTVRKFTGRTSTGVRGIKLAEGDSVISMTVLQKMDLSIEERDAYLKQAAKLRRESGTDEDGFEPEIETTSGIELSAERFAELAAQEQFILAATTRGYGKRTSSYEFRSTGRGGQGFASMELTDKNGSVVASFPIQETDQVMLVTDQGQLIRCPVNDVRIAGRRTQGVFLLRVGDDEEVVSVARIKEPEEDEDLENSSSEAEGADTASEIETAASEENPS